VLALEFAFLRAQINFCEVRAEVKVNDNTNSIVLYSTNTLLAFRIAETYYQGKHYVWCSPYFEPGDSKLNYTIAPTSSPKDIYLNLHDEALRGDQHSAKIANNRVGIINGANLKKAAGVISSQELEEIIAIVHGAQIIDFRPLLYIIPYSLVTDICRKASIHERAAPFSEEYIIEALPSSCFHAIVIK